MIGGGRGRGDRREDGGQGRRPPPHQAEGGNRYGSSTRPQREETRRSQRYKSRIWRKRTEKERPQGGQQERLST